MGSIMATAAKRTVSQHGSVDRSLYVCESLRVERQEARRGLEDALCTVQSFSALRFRGVFDENEYNGHVKHLLSSLWAPDVRQPSRVGATPAL